MTVPQALIEAATAYEALFVPALFQQWAPIVADAAHIKSGDRVLDVACGTGVLAREAAARAGQTGHVVGIDPHAGMLAGPQSTGKRAQPRRCRSPTAPSTPSSASSGSCSLLTATWPFVKCCA